MMLRFDHVNTTAASRKKTPKYGRIVPFHTHSKIEPMVKRSTPRRTRTHLSKLADVRSAQLIPETRTKTTGLGASTPFHASMMRTKKCGSLAPIAAERLRYPW